MKKTDIPATDFPSMEFVTEDFDLFFVIKEIKAQISNSLKGNRRNALWIFLPFLLLLPLLHSCFLNKVTKYEYSDTMIITEEDAKNGSKVLKKTFRVGFYKAWQEINGKNRDAHWNSNPTVWVIEFRTKEDYVRK